MQLLSFLLPVRIDNEDRWNNLLTSLRYLTQTCPESEIVIIEDAPVSKCFHLGNQFNVRYFFRENSGNFSKSNTINTGLIQATRKYIAVYDVDVLISRKQIDKAIKLLECGTKFIILPHNSIFVNVEGELRDRLIKSMDVKIIPKISTLFLHRSIKDVKPSSIPSGVVIFNKDILLKIGGFNKKMVSYGWEDIEVLKRAAILGIYYYAFASGNIIHLDHERGKDSSPNEFYEFNRNEFHHVCSLTKKELIKYIRTDLALNNTKTIDQNDINMIRQMNIFNQNFLRYVFNRIVLKIISLKLK